MWNWNRSYVYLPRISVDSLVVGHWEFHFLQGGGITGTLQNSVSWSVCWHVSFKNQLKLVFQFDSITVANHEDQVFQAFIVSATLQCCWGIRKNLYVKDHETRQAYFLTPLPRAAFLSLPSLFPLPKCCDPPPLKWHSSIGPGRTNQILKVCCPILRLVVAQE